MRKLTIAAAMILGLASMSLSAQTYKLPNAHAAEHSQLIAGQSKIDQQIKVEATQKFLDKLFAEEQEPEGDIYTEGWESQRVNCYVGAKVPQRKTIDVSNFAMPVPGYMTSPYGYRARFGRMHRGVDLKAFTGDTIRAAFDGKIRLTRYEANGYGYYVVMRHPNELETVYGHMSKFLVKPNQYVKAGDPIGLAGNTGRSFGSHLHFETRYMGYAINPSAIFDFANQTVHTDSYTFDKSTYEQARNFDPRATQAHQARYMQSQQAKAAAAKAKSAYTKPATRTGASSSKSKSASKKTASAYTVQKGDNLSKVAARSGISVNELCKRNGIKSSATLKPGQKLKVK